MTHHVDVQQARETLNYDEMLALSGMFERWALTEEEIDGEQRTKLIQWSSDYEAIAAFAGPAWLSTDTSGQVSVLTFVARRELAARDHPTGRGDPEPVL